MEDIIGGGSDDERFAGFLADWEAVLSRRVEQVKSELQSIDGLAAAVLAGSLGRGAPWPLSDIDLILIVELEREGDVRASVDTIRDRLTAGWAAEGWWTGLDAGRLLFSMDEIDRVIADGVSPLRALGDSRWFHTMDKAFGGHALVEDASGRAARLAAWATANRFAPAIVEDRDRRLREEFVTVPTAGRRAAEAEDAVRGTMALWRSVQIMQIAMMGRWGLRDNSLGRFGSRFASAASERGLGEVVRQLDALSDLDPDSLARRALVAPAWVVLRHDRSLRARLAVGEPVTALADLRDTLRVCSRYDAVRHTGPAFPEWLGVVTDEVGLRRRLDAVGMIATQLGWTTADSQSSAST